MFSSPHYNEQKSGIMFKDLQPNHQWCNEHSNAKKIELENLKLLKEIKTILNEKLINKNGPQNEPQNMAEPNLEQRIQTTAAQNNPKFGKNKDGEILIMKNTILKKTYDYKRHLNRVFLLHLIIFLAHSYVNFCFIIR